MKISFLFQLPFTILLFIVFGLFVSYMMTRNKYLINKICYWLFAFAISGGFLIYSYCHLPENAGLINLPLATLRGLFSSVRMVFLNADYELFVEAFGQEYLSENLWLQIVFWLLHLFVLIGMQAAVISLFGRKIIDEFRLQFGQHREVFIIKGSDKNALMLGENIATHDNTEKKTDSNRIVIFWIDEQDDEKKIFEKVSHFGGIVQVLERENNLENYLKKTRMGKNNPFLKKRKYNLILMSKNVSISDETKVIVDYAKQKGVKHDELDIFVFASTEWEKEKIEKITQAKDEQGRKYPYTFHIINEIDLWIRMMIEKHPPFESDGLKFSNGIATRGFTAIITGFGTVGQSALLRLIMNGQFVGGKMRALIIDKNIDDLRDCFLHRYPALQLCCDLEFYNFDVNCDKFFDLLKNTENVDYVVIALNDNDLNKRTALDIELHFNRKDKKAMPVIAVADKNGCQHKKEKNEKIFTFGCCEEIYKESVIIREENDRIAKAINDTYRKLYGGKYWHELDCFLQESNRASADFIPAMIYLVNPKLTIEEVRNKETLTDDKNLAEILSQTEHLRWNAFHLAMGYSPITIEKMHQRFKEYKGEPNPDKQLDFARRDSIDKLQVCIVTWDELDIVSESYREFENLAGKKPKRDFKNNDRDIIGNLPKFLQEAKK